MQRLQSVQLQLQGENINGDLFSHVKMAPPDPILGTAIAFKNDKNSDKVNLGIGAYRDADGKPYVFKIVRKVEEEIVKSGVNKEYLPIDGSPEFCAGTRNLLFGSDSSAVKDKRVATCQSISGTGALSLGFTFISQNLPRMVYISNPTWLNHKNIIDYTGLKWAEYPYFDPKTKGFNYEAMIKFLENAINGSIVLLHACAHNPTGVDPTQEQWKRIAQVMKKNSLIPFFDSAYQGFATGDLIKDAWPIRHFIEQGFQMIVSQSFAKNIGLYGERVGALHVVGANKETTDKVLSQIKIIARKMYSSPPLHGSLIVEKILNNKENFDSWQNELKNDVASRIIKMRTLLREELERIKTPGTWKHITDQIGMFSFTGLNVKQCETLINKYHIYLLKSGRISMAGINEKNYKYLAQSIKASIEENSN